MAGCSGSLRDLATDFSSSANSAGFAYKVTDYYNPKGERTIVWNDPDTRDSVAVASPKKPSSPIRIAQGATLGDGGGFRLSIWPRVLVTGR